MRLIQEETIYSNSTVLVRTAVRDRKQTRTLETHFGEKFLDHEERLSSRSLEVYKYVYKEETNGYEFAFDFKDANVSRKEEFVDHKRKEEKRKEW